MDTSQISEVLDQRIADARDAVADGRLDDATELLDAILRIDPDRSEAWNLRSRALLAQDRLSAATENAAEAIARFPGALSHRMTLGRLHLRAGRRDLAAQAFREILSRRALHLNAIRELMDIETIPPGDDIDRRLRDGASEPGLGLYDRASTWFLRGQIHMMAGQDDAAFALFDEGNRLMRELHEHQRLEYSFSRLLPSLDRAFQQRHAPQPAPDPCPLLLVVGLPRSGKSLLEKLLASQSGLVATGETTLLYDLFLEVDRRSGADATIAALRALPGDPIRAHFTARIAQGPRPQAIRAIDTTPGNLEQLGLLGPLHPDVPIVFVTRETRDLAASLFFKQFNRAHRYTYDLGTAARAIARTEFLARHWQATMPNPMIAVSYEDTVTDPIGTARSILARFSLPVDDEALAVAAGHGQEAFNLLPGRSVDGLGAIRPDLMGFSERFSRQLAPVLPAYRAEAEALT